MVMDDVVLLLANSAEETQPGMMSALGIGWSITASPTPPTGLLLFVKVPWDQTNVRHKAVLALLDDDGRPASVDGGPMEITFEFEAGRPAGVTRGTPIDWSHAFNLAPIDLEPGRYEWRFTIDGDHAATRAFAVRPQAQA